MIFSVKELITEVERDLDERKILYKDLIKSGKLKRETAIQQYRRMQAVKVFLDIMQETCECVNMVSKDKSNEND